MPLELKSNAFASGGIIPARYTCDGENISPPLEWRGMPIETRSLALICDDPDAPKGPRCHWILYNIPDDMDRLPEGIPAGERLPWGGIQGRNDFGLLRYEGPCPPAGTFHKYCFRLYALDKRVNLLPGGTHQQVIDRIRDYVLTSTELFGRYGRS